MILSLHNTQPEILVPKWLEKLSRINIVPSDSNKLGITSYETVNKWHQIVKKCDKFMFWVCFTFAVAVTVMFMCIFPFAM